MGEGCAPAHARVPVVAGDVDLSWRELRFVAHDEVLRWLLIIYSIGHGAILYGRAEHHQIAGDPPVNIYKGPVAPTYAASVRFEVKSSVSQLTKNIGTYMSAWQDTKDIVTLSMNLVANQSQEGTGCNFLFLWTASPLTLEVTFPSPVGVPAQQIAVPVSSAFFIDTPILTWKVTNTSLNPVNAELTFATTEPA